MSNATSEPIKVHCPQCHKKMGFPPSASGRKAKCPACSHVFRVASAEPAPVLSKTSRERPANESASLFDALAAAEQSAEQAELSEEEAASARAAALAANSAEQSARAGFVRGEEKPSAKATGRREKATRERGEPDASFWGRDGSMLALIRGIGFSAVGALVAVAAWYGLAKATTGSGPAFMPLVVGIASALGMTLGLRRETKIGGILAAGITWVGIGAGQVAVIIGILIPRLEAQAKVVEDSIDFQRRVVMQNEIDIAYEEANVAPGEMTPGRAKEIEMMGRRKFGTYDDDKIRTEYKKLQALAGPPPAPKPIATAGELMKEALTSYGVLVCSVGALIVAFFVGSGILGLGIE